MSWNFKHIVRAWTIERVDRVNVQLGFGHVRIYTPEEVISFEVEGA